MVSAIFLPSSLLVYFTRPDLFTRFGIAGGLLFGASCGFPLVFACSCPWYAFYWAASQAEKHEQRVSDALHNVPVKDDPTLAEQVATDDPFEWSTLLLGGWTANLVLYVLVMIAYYRPIQLGKTLLLTVAIVLGIWLVLAVLFTIALKKRKREADARIESIYKARSQPQAC